MQINNFLIFSIIIFIIIIIFLLFYIRQSKNLWSKKTSLFEIAPVGIFESDLQGNYTLVNSEFEEIFDYKAKDLYKIKVWDTLANIVDREKKSDYLEMLINKQPIPRPYIEKIKTGKGVKKEIEVIWQYTKDCKGKLVGFVSVVSDITKKQVDKAEKIKLDEELCDKNKELEQIIFVASHDLRSPLVNIQGFSGELSKTVENLNELIEKMIISEDVKAKFEEIKQDTTLSIDYILSSVSKMNLLLSGLLTIARSGKKEIKYESIDVDDLVNKVILNIEYKVKEARASISVEDLPSCRADKIQLEQVFQNLIDNALKYSNPNLPSEILVFGSKTRDSNVYCVSDNGQGISMNNQTKIFNLFHRLKPKQNDGLGIGMSIVQKIILKHNGKIWVESQENKGTQIFFSIPF